MRRLLVLLGTKVCLESVHTAYTHLSTRLLCSRYNDDGATVQDEYWNNQVMQIQVQPNLELDLALRVGNAVVHLGEARNFEQKMNNLRAFYDKVLPNVGWNRYQSISVAYENQVIGTKQTE